MIRYALACDKGHVFESWFQNSSAYEKQVKAALIACPVCSSTKVEKTIMAPGVVGAKKSGKAPPPELPAAPRPSSEAPSPPTGGVACRDDLTAGARVSQETEGAARSSHKKRRLCRPKFPEEARKMHYGEIEHRSIYGEATSDQAKELHEEGIEFHPLPVLPDERN